MALEDLLDVAESQLERESASPGIPSYLIAAGNHQVASGFSLTSPDTWGESAAGLGKFALTATARAVTSVYNILPETVNWLGGTMETADTYNVLSSFDNNLADYYAMNQGDVDIAGDVLGSIVPGWAGVKVLNYGQKALAAASAGRHGFNMASHIGLLPSYATMRGFEAGKQMAASSQAFSLLNTNVLKSMAAGYGQQALESAAFLGAAQLAMGNSPVFEKQDASDIFWNSVWGAGFGAGIMGSFAAAKTYGAVKSGMKAADRALNPATFYTATEATLDPASKIAIALHDIYHPPVAPAGETPELIAAFNKRLADRQNTLKNILYTEANNMVKDPELAKIFSDSMRGVPYEVAVGNTEHLVNISRAGVGKTALEKLADKVKSGFSAETPPNLAVGYVKLHGEDAFQVSWDKPAVLNIADTVKSSQQVHQFVSNQKFKITDVWAPSLADDALKAEARYIWTSKIEKLPEQVSPRDVPMLERIMLSGAEKIQLTDGQTIYAQDMMDYLKKTKLKEAYLLQEAYPKMTIAEVAKRINVKAGLLEGTAVSKTDEISDWIAVDFSKKTWEQPQYAKMAYDVKPMMDDNGFVMDAVTHAKANQKELRQAVEIALVSEGGIFAEVNALLPNRIGDKAIMEAYRGGAGGGMFSIQNENYGTVGSIMQQIGSVVNKAKTKIIDGVTEKFTPSAYAVLNDTAARDDIVKAYNLVLGSPEKYVLDADGMLRMKKVSDAMKAKDGKWPALLDKNSPIEIPIKSEAARTFLSSWIAHNDTVLASQAKRNLYQVGTPSQNLQGTLYIPPPDPKNYSHFAFVVDSSVTGTGHVRMIHAADSSKLEQLAEQVRAIPGTKVIFKGQSEDFHKAMQDYKFDLGINENTINSAMARKGVSAPYFAVTDANKIVEEMLDWRKRKDVSNFREWVKLKYAPEFESLNQLSKSYTDLAGSTKSYAGKYAGDTVKDPYGDLIKTALDISRKEEYPIWTPLNRLLENGVSKVYAALQDSVNKAPVGQELERMQSVLHEAGISANFTDAATMALANHTAPKPVLEEFIRKANSALSFLMLRTDPLNAMNNGFGHAVLYGSETRDLIQNIMKGNVEAAGELALLSRVKIPGEQLGSILSPSKLAAGAYRDYARYLAGDETAKASYEFFKAHGWLPDLIEQEKSIMNALTLKGTESQSELALKLTKAQDAVKTLAKPLTKLNQGVEDMNRFVAAHTAKSISDLGIKYGIIDADQQLSYINTFVNRTQGNYIANQRPMLFQGPVGQAVSLFQTYQFNLMQQLFRYVGEGNNKSAAVLLGLQGTIYGMNGLPAFNAINTHLVGNASGNITHQDIISKTYDLAGKEAGNWLMYGVASNMLIHPDAKVNLYSRGDINPRQITVIPTNPADVPVVGAITKILGSVKTTAGRIAAGGDAYSSILQGIEHAGISRPLAGLAQVAEAFGNPNLQSYSTTSKGNIIGANDLFSLTTFARLAGGRPLDEAIANDAVYRIRAYSAARTAEINELGAAVKTKVQTGTLDAESLNKFMGEYVKRGGKQEQFSKFIMREMKTANVSAANQLAQDLKNPLSQQMQSIMGGYALQDLANYQ